MTIPRAATEQYEVQRRIAAVTAAAVRREVLSIGNDFDAGWTAARARVESRVQLGRAATVNASLGYTSTVLAETNQVGTPAGAVVPSAFLRNAPNGLPVLDTFDAVPVKAKQAIAGGAGVAEARMLAAGWAARAAVTMLADTGRDIYQADMISRPQVTGYVRMVSAGACRACILLAGKRFLWNQGFERHPGCNCRHIPASEALAGDWATDPYAYFKSLSKAEQDRVFGAIQAEAIRDGADIYRVVNVSNRGLATAAGNRSYGTPYRRTLEDIYSHDRDRKFVIENLRYHGYITGPQTPGGNILGNYPAGRVLAAGRGRGTYKVGGQVVTTKRAAAFDAVSSGSRDPLNRATMTAAERRLYDAHYRAQWADAGYRPNSIGANSADRGLGLRPITTAETAQARSTLQAELARALEPSSPKQVYDLARLLGLA